MMSVRILKHANKHIHHHGITLPYLTNIRSIAPTTSTKIIYMKTHHHHHEHHHHHLHHHIYHFSSKIVLTICSLIINNIISNLRIFIYICELTEGKRKTLIKHKKCFQNVVIILRKKKKRKRKLRNRI